jgi:hypothetical protein
MNNKFTPKNLNIWNMQHVYAQSLLFADDIVLTADKKKNYRNR